MFSYIFSSIHKIQQNFYSFFSNETYKLLFIFWISKQFFKFQKFISYIEKENLDFYIIRTLKYIYSFFTKRCFEPEDSTWVNYIIEDIRNTENHMDYYNKNPFVDLNSDEIQQKCKKIYNDSIELYNSNSIIYRLLLTIKMYDFYIVKTINFKQNITENKNEYKNNFMMVKSKKSIISIR